MKKLKFFKCIFLQGDKSSRAQILKKASEYIAFMRQNNGRNSKDIEDLRRQNAHLENQVSGEIIVSKNDFLYFRFELWRRQRAQEIFQV